MSATSFPWIDLALAKRLERAEGHANAMFVESRARQVPELGACWTNVAGAYAMFDGVGSPLTQAFGLGVFEPVTDAALTSLEAFFFERGADVFLEISPLADQGALSLLHTRGYRPCELTSVLFQPLPSVAVVVAPASSFVASRVTPPEADAWAETALRGWGESREVQEFMSSFGPTAVRAEDAHPFLVRSGSTPVAAGSLAIHGETALLAGASTIPEHRGRGAQQALLAARLQFASTRGCTLAMMCALPGSPSQRNAERSGFRVAYTRIKWHRPRPDAAV